MRGPNRLEPGRGNIDWKEVMKVLKDIGYQGFYGFECVASKKTDLALDSAFKVLGIS